MRLKNVQSGYAGVTIVLCGLVATTPALAQKSYDRGASDSEIRIGNTAPYSGPGSAYSTIAKVEDAYFKMVNDNGGVNGRKIRFFSYDDASSPPKTVEQVRKLVERDDVLLMFNTIATAPNLAVRNYLNARRVPQLFAGSGSSEFGDPKNYPWTMGLNQSYRSEGRIYAQYILQNIPNAKVAVLSQNDDFGTDYVKGLREGLGAKAATMIVAEATYEPTDPTIDSQILKLKASGADVFMDATTPKFAAQSIKKLAEIGWKPTVLLDSISVSVGAVLKPAGLENSQGILSAGYLMDPTDSSWENGAAMKEWQVFMGRYFPDGNKADWNNVYGYVAAEALIKVLAQCGDNLTRANVMKQAASLNQVKLPLLLPGVTVNTSSTNFHPLDQFQMMRFKGGTWEIFGPVLNAHTSG
jgi:branched-chain amino acid transport system substrate-binding protein